MLASYKILAIIILVINTDFMINTDFILRMEEWQDSWNSTPTNKLFSIKPVLGKTNRMHHYAVVTKQSSLG